MWTRETIWNSRASSTRSAPDTNASAARHRSRHWRRALGALSPLHIGPEGFLLIQRQARKVEPAGSRQNLHTMESFRKLCVGRAKRFLRVDLQLPAEVGDHEQDIAELFGDMSLV